ncbi:MAG: hypothetical protein ACK5WS_04570 [Alphaproteobacteria bacterium]|jgi:hypothetical protein|nr:hypothetical protein [Candidatus Jidaibacter sp.]
MLQAYQPYNQTKTNITDILNGKIPDIGEVQLSYCDINSSQAISLFEKLVSMPSLKTIDLSSNNINSDASFSIKAFLETHASITEINLSFNRLEDKGIQPILEAVIVNSSLKKLSLSNNGITTQSEEWIGNIIRKNISLIHIDVSSLFEDPTFSKYKSNDIGYATAKAVAASLPYNSSLITFECTNSLTKFVAQKLQTQFQARNKTIELTISKYLDNRMTLNDLKIANRYMPAILSTLELQGKNQNEFANRIHNKLVSCAHFIYENSFSTLTFDLIGVIFNNLDKVSIARFFATAKMKEYHAEEQIKL